jgi:chromosome segregation ATPase
MRANDNVVSLVRSQPEIEPEKSPSDMPNLSFDEASGLAEIETQANQLLDYIGKLSNLADRACVTAIRQTETAQRSEETRQTEVATLRNQLEQSTSALQERNLAFTMLDNSSREQMASMEQRLRAAERQLEERETEVASLNRQINELANRPNTPGYTTEQLEQQVAEKTAALKNQLSQRDELVKSKTSMFKKAEADFRANIMELEQRLKDAEGTVQRQETQLKDKETVLQATAAKEVEIGKLIKRLSLECENLSNELQEKTRLMGQLDGKKPQTQPDKNVWRRMIGRLQDEPL